MKSERTVPTIESSKTRRVVVNFAPSAYYILREVAEQSGTTVSETLRDAIALKKWWEDVHLNGGRVLVQRGGSIREINRI